MMFSGGSGFDAVGQQRDHRVIEHELLSPKLIDQRQALVANNNLRPRQKTVLIFQRSRFRHIVTLASCNASSTVSQFGSTERASARSPDSYLTNKRNNSSSAIFGRLSGFDIPTYSPNWRIYLKHPKKHEGFRCGRKLHCSQCIRARGGCIDLSVELLGDLASVFFISALNRILFSAATDSV